MFATGGRAGGRAGGVRTLLQPARAQCLRLSERFFVSCEAPYSATIHKFSVQSKRAGQDSMLEFVPRNTSAAA